ARRRGVAYSWSRRGGSRRGLGTLVRCAAIPGGTAARRLIERTREDVEARGRVAEMGRDHAQERSLFGRRVVADPLLDDACRIGDASLHESTRRLADEAGELRVLARVHGPPA